MEKPRKLRPGYIELKGKIVFPKGNPFPGGQLPSMQIKCRDKSADPARRAPIVRQDGSFSTDLKAGQTYDLYWMSYFGFLTRFASIHVRREGPKERHAVIYVHERQKTASTRNNSQTGANTGGQPQSGPAYQMPQSGPAYQAPQTGPAFQAPQTGPAFQTPQTGPAFQAPQTGPAFQTPQSN